VLPGGVQAGTDAGVTKAVRGTLRVADKYVASKAAPSVVQQQLMPPTGDKHDYSSLYWVCQGVATGPCQPPKSLLRVVGSGADAERNMGCGGTLAVHMAVQRCAVRGGRGMQRGRAAVGVLRRAPQPRHSLQNRKGKAGRLASIHARYDVHWVWTDLTAWAWITMMQKHLYDMIAGVTSLGVAYYHTGREEYVTHAVRMLKTFFVDKETRMNPNFQHSQVRGRE
jgi:hypothetical protein